MLAIRFVKRRGLSWLHNKVKVDCSTGGPTGDGDRELAKVDGVLPMTTTSKVRVNVDPSLSDVRVDIAV